MSFAGFKTLFSVALLLVAIGFAIVLAFMIIRLLRNEKQWRHDNASPVLTVFAAVVAKRTEVTYYRHRMIGSMHSGVSPTSYFVTFQVESRDRMELEVPDTEYGLLAEGDVGRLTFQGSRYQGFERQ